MHFRCTYGETNGLKENSILEKIEGEYFKTDAAKLRRLS